MKKALSIILAILMIVTTIPFAFAADETPDFSDAKVLTSVDGVLYIDGVEAETNSSKSQSRIYEGKYILEGDIETSRYIWILGDTTLDLNGYTWNLADKHIIANMPLSVYDTSEAETGKITSVDSRTILLNDKNAVFSLYSGTIKNTSISSRCALDVAFADVNLYAGKIKGNSYAIACNLGDDLTINIDDTVIESGDGYADIFVFLGINVIAGDIDVTDYKGDSLTASVSLYDAVGKITIFKGIKDAQDAEKYQIIDVVCDKYYDTYYEKTEYDEATGEKSIYTAKNAFTQQPSADNNFTVDFNNPAATFQWYEVEEENLGTYEAYEGDIVFTYDFKAGDILVISTDSEFELVVIKTGIIDTDYEYIYLDENEKTATITFDADTTVDFFTDFVDADNPVEVNFTVFKETKLDGETEKTLQNAECGKSYYCKATVGEKVYVSDSVVGHSLVSVDAQAPTCTEIGWEAYEYCTACDYTTYVEKEALNHKDTLVQVEAKAPTCTEIGWDAYEYCTACDYTTYVEIPALGHADADNDGVCDNGCGAEVVTLGGNVYPVDGDITNTGIHIGAFAAFDNCYKAGDGYILIKGEGNDDTVMTLYNATIDVRGTGHKDAIRVDGEDIEIRFFGENNIFADEEAYATPIGNSRHSQTFIGADDAVLNLYGNVSVSYINIESGTVNVYGADVDDIESVYVERNLVVSEGAVLNIISGDNGMGFNCGIIVQKEIVAEGEFNAIALTGSETDNETIYNLTAIGNAVLGADTYNPYHGMEIPEDFNFEINFIVPEGTSVTVPEGITLNLDSMTNVDIDGKLIVYGTLICTHTDEDNDYLCDIGCGTEFADIDGVKYEVIGDVTYTGVEFSGSESMDSGCYKAGDGYVIIGEDKSELTLYNATVDLRGTDAKHALYHGTYSTAVKIFFKGINNIYPNEGGKSLISEYVGYGNESFNFIGDDGAILNLYGDTEYTNFNFVSGEVNIYGNGATGVVSIFNNKDVTIGENATVNLVSAAGIGGFLGDVIVSENNMFTVDGVFNGVTFEMGEIVDNTMTVTYTVYGNAVAGQDYINLITESGITVELIIPEGTSFTIPEGYAINLDTFDNVVIDGELIVDGTLICTHTGGEATCNEKAVCDICKNTYGETLAHTDEDGDYICDNGCGYEYEKPAEPTPEAPEDIDTEVCEDCGKVHDGFFAQLICFFTKIINFIKNLFA